jgi:hypothetical protein
MGKPRQHIDPLVVKKKTELNRRMTGEGCEKL